MGERRAVAWDRNDAAVLRLADDLGSLSFSDFRTLAERGGLGGLDGLGCGIACGACGNRADQMHAASWTHECENGTGTAATQNGAR